MSGDVLGRLSQRAFGERPAAAPRDESPVAPAHVFADLDVLTEESHDGEQSRTPRPTVEPVANAEARANPRHRTPDDKSPADTGTAMPRDEYCRVPVVPAKEVSAIAEPQPDPKPASVGPSAIEVRQQSTQVVPRATPPADAPTEKKAGSQRGRSARDESGPSLGEVRPRAEKSVAIEVAHDTRPRRRADATDSADSDETIVNVHIGRIEVRAPRSTQPVVHSQLQRAKPSSLSLASYLAARSRGRG